MSALATTAIEVPDLSRIAHATEADLRAALQITAAARRRVDAVLAGLSAEVERRSARELGHAGLAQRSGARTSDALVTQLTGVSGTEARQLVAIGTMLEDSEPWLADVAAAVSGGELSVGAAAAIRAGLGAPSAEVAADDLLDAAQRLVAEAPALPPEKVARRARELRDELDAAGVADREAALRAKRFLRLSPLPDGMTRISGLLDPESAALVTDALDCVTAPRRGGPRFVDSEERARAEALERDPRSTDQLALDALVEMVRIAGAADAGRVFGVRRPAVRVHVAVDDLVRGSGAAWLEGQSAAVSVATAERLACSGSYQPIVVRPDERLDVGRAQRLFTERQRIALAVVWGGCAIEQCDRPPSWTEAHHADPWSRGGPTDVDNGVLLCRHHHLLLHNGGWRIDRPPGRGHDGWSMTDGVRVLRLLTKNPLRRRGSRVARRSGA